MAHAPKASIETVNAQADAIAALLDDGYIRVYTGPKPATADDAITSQTLLAELRFASPAAPAAVNGVLTFAAITPEGSAPASGTAAWCRFLKSDGTSPAGDFTVGTTSGSDVVLTTVAIAATDPVPLDALSLRVPKG